MQLEPSNDPPESIRAWRLDPTNRSLSESSAAVAYGHTAWPEGHMGSLWLIFLVALAGAVPDTGLARFSGQPD